MGPPINLSADAAGYGWFVDTKPVAQTRLVPPIATTGHEDLLTVVMHELGHTLGLGDLDSTRFSTDLMATTLATGVRRLPSALDVASVIKSHAARPEDLTNASLVDAVLGDYEKGAPVVMGNALPPANSAMPRRVPRVTSNAPTSLLDLLSRRVPGSRRSAVTHTTKTPNEGVRHTKGR